LAMWWLKPLFDRIVLHVLAGAVFGSRPTWRETLRAVPGFARNGLLLGLTLHRVSTIRSFALPVRQLESASGATARSRVAQLRKRVGGYAAWLMLVCVGFETVVFFSLFGLYDLLMPASVREFFDAFSLLKPFQANQGLALYISTAAYLVAIALVEPFYVAGGFALYLNRRIALEGWDLEVQLRRLAPTRERIGRRAVFAVTAMLIAAMVALLMDNHDARAQLAAQPERRAAFEIKQVLAQPEFQEYEEQFRIVELLPSPPDAPAKRWDLSGLGGLIKGLSEVVRVLVWLAIAGVVFVVVYWVVQRVSARQSTVNTEWHAPETLFGLDVRPEALPDDVAATARQLAQSGNLVGALSLLYRASLATLLARDRVELNSSDTETDCLQKSRIRLAAPAQGYLERLVETWRATVYAHHTPPLRDVERLAVEWSDYFRLHQ
ncbi:MAG: hypothetical protein ABI612_24750, partial [Betaproteobacteria bacterium]